MATVICDNRISENCKNTLIREGFAVIALPACDRLPEPIASHTDMLIFTDGKSVFSEEKYRSLNAELFSHIEKTLKGTEFIYTDEEFDRQYPGDAILNALLAENMLFAKTDSCSRKLLDYAENNNLKYVAYYSEAEAENFEKDTTTTPF